MLTLRLAWRSFLRHKRRSIITTVAVAFSLGLLLLMLAMITDSHQKVAEMGIRMGLGHVIVQAPGYKAERTLDHIVADPARVVAAARRVRGLVDVVQRVVVSGLISTGEDSAAVLIAGVDPLREPKVSDIAAPKRRVAGKYLRRRADMRFKNQPADIYIGRALAKRLKLGLGDRLVLTASARGGGRPATMAFFVRGIFKSGSTELDGLLVQVPIGAAKRMLKLGSAATEVALLLDRMNRTAAAAAAMKRALAGDKSIRVMPWQVARKDLYDALEIDTASGMIPVAILFIIVAIGIFNTVLMSVVERTREFGVMMAIGTSPGRMFAIVLTEAGLLGTIAVALGIGLGAALSAWLASTGLDINAMMGTESYEFAGVAFEGRIYAQMLASDVIKSSVITFGLVLLSAVYPAWRATRLDPVEAMRHT